MRSILILLCVMAQVVALGSMVYSRESVIGSGQRIHIASAPIDPRDPFRGDFVRLTYPMNSFSSAPTLWTKETAPKRGDKLYAVLEAQPSGLYTVKHFTTSPPNDNTLYIRGRRVSHSPSLDTSLDFVRNGRRDVKFGLEQMFVQQGKGLDIEAKQGLRGGMQTAMEVEVALDSKGTAVLTGYRWSALSIQVELADNFAALPVSTTNDQEVPSEETQATAPLRVTVQNNSDAAVTLNNPGNNCGFQLEPANPMQTRYQASTAECEAATTLSPLTLEPLQTYSFTVNPQASRWQVIDTESADNQNQTIDLRTIADRNTRFRVVYRSTNTMANNSTLWIGDLISQAFNTTGRVD